MDREHLTEYELYALLDEDPGSENPSARAHLAGCEECRASWQNARNAVSLLEHLPYQSPSSGFANRVMLQVRVFEPLQVTILDSLARLVPSGPGLRTALAGAAALGGLVLTSLMLWAASRVEQVFFLANLGVERGRLAALNGAEQMAVAIVGEPTMAMLGLTGTRGIWFTLGILGASALISTLGLRLFASAARRGRS